MVLMYRLALAIADNIDNYVCNFSEDGLITSNEAMDISYKTAYSFMDGLAKNYSLQEILESMDKAQEDIEIEAVREFVRGGEIDI